MSGINFERLSILLVEDNIYIRDIIENVLRNLGFGWVATARNGQEAVEFLRLVSKNPSAAGVMNVDIILCDLVMSPINGLLLLKWVRTSKDCPNRMLPFIMISGAADRDHVHAARDQGVTEFAAKPFSVQSVLDRILAVIEYPRQFVASQSYFGPDRRRKKTTLPDGKDRRRAEDINATVVYSADNIKTPKNASDVWFFRLPNALKDKVGGAQIKGSLALPKDILEKAEKQLERSSLDFADWAMSYLAKLSQLITDALIQPKGRKHYFEEIHLVAHELRGQGGTFGYPLITILAKSLYDATEVGTPEDDAALELCKAHADSMRAVIRDRVAGDGGQIGKALLAGLKQAIDKNKHDRETVA